MRIPLYLLVNAQRTGEHGDGAPGAPVLCDSAAGRRGAVAIALATLTLLVAIGAGVFGLGQVACPARVAVTGFAAPGFSVPQAPAPWKAPEAPLRLLAIAAASAPAAPSERRRPLDGLELDQAAVGSAEAGAEALLYASAVHLARRPVSARRFTPRCARAPPA